MGHQRSYLFSFFFSARGGGLGGRCHYFDTNADIHRHNKSSLKAVSSFEHPLNSQFPCLNHENGSSTQAPKPGKSYPPLGSSHTPASDSEERELKQLDVPDENLVELEGTSTAFTCCFSGQTLVGGFDWRFFPPGFCRGLRGNLPNHQTTHPNHHIEGS